MTRPLCPALRRRLAYRILGCATVWAAAFIAGSGPCRAQGHHHHSGGLQGSISQGFTPAGGFSQNVGIAAPGPIVHDPNFGSPFYN
ncbi:MAG: hypothetical protein ACKO85_09495, partial [Isosphaeraceae bacterium]